jgi:hypothetical protein
MSISSNIALENTTMSVSNSTINNNKAYGASRRWSACWQYLSAAVVTDWCRCSVTGKRDNVYVSMSCGPMLLTGDGGGAYLAIFDSMANTSLTVSHVTAINNSADGGAWDRSIGISRCTAVRGLCIQSEG